MTTIKRVGVMMDLEQSNKRHVEVLAGIDAFAREHPDWQLVVDDWADHTVANLQDGVPRYDGIIGRITSLGERQARRLGVPAVNVWISSPAEGLPSVFPDYGASGKLVAEYLLSHGFLHMAALVHPHDRAVLSQTAAFKASAEAASNATWCGTLATPWPSNHGEWQQAILDVEKWMDGFQLPVGLLIREPGHARLVINLANARGWRIPEDVALVCSYNEAPLCEQPEPGITGVNMPNEACGREAAKLLDHLIDVRRRGDDPFANPQTVLLPPGEIVCRASTERAAAATPEPQIPGCP